MTNTLLILCCSFTLRIAFMVLTKNIACGQERQASAVYFSVQIGFCVVFYSKKKKKKTFYPGVIDVFMLFLLSVKWDFTILLLTAKSLEHDFSAGKIMSYWWPRLAFSGLLEAAGLNAREPRNSLHFKKILSFWKATLESIDTPYSTYLAFGILFTWNLSRSN